MPSVCLASKGARADGSTRSTSTSLRGERSKEKTNNDLQVNLYHNWNKTGHC